MGAYFLTKQARSPILEGFGRNIYALLSFSGQQYSRMMMQQITRYQIERCQPDILIRMSGNAYDMLEFHHAESIVETGIEITRNALDRIGVTSQEG